MDKKQILVVTDWLFPNMNANSEIAYRIAEVLNKQYSCDITIIGYEQFNNQSKKTDSSEFDTVRLKMTSEICCSELFKDSRYRRKQYLLHPYKYRYVYFSRISKQKPLYHEYMDSIRRILRKKNIDCIIGFYMPEIALLSLVNIKTKIPIIVYKVDPWATFYSYRDNPVKLENERIVENRANAIITTNQILRDSRSYASKRILNKTTALEFPNVVSYQDIRNTNLLCKNRINCVFTGTLYPTIRNPKYTIELFEKLADFNIFFYIFGRQNPADFIPKNLPYNIKYCGIVSSEDVISIMQSADVLVNIGNTEMNLLPSKLFTYISIGKPILNIIKASKCPTLPYMDRYPLGYNVLETQDVSIEAVNGVRNFILANKGKRIPFETIKELYYDCTPEYVGGKVHEIITKVVEESKRSNK